jgi:hypothetical protein
MAIKEVGKENSLRHHYEIGTVRNRKKHFLERYLQLSLVNLAI